jgi:proto-oncogene tyrosine-protein kinase ROS
MKIATKASHLFPEQNSKIINGSISVTLSKLLPNQSYKIWVIAYATKFAFTESDFVTTSTFPGPENLVLNSTNSYNMTLRWNKPEHVFKYVIQYSSPENSDWVDGFSSETDVIYQVDEKNRTYYFIGNLLPKTKYQFSLKLYYAQSPLRAYRWPPQQTEDSRYVFETLGDAPSAPGKPTVKSVKENIFQVIWDPSRENGAPIEEYLLETKIQIEENFVIERVDRVQRSINDSNSVTSFRNEDLNEVHLDFQEYENMLKTQSNPTTEIIKVDHRDAEQTTYPSDDSEEGFGWHKQYAGTDNYWIINDLDQITDHVFRVRAKNSYGWGPFSEISDVVDTSVTTEFPNNSNLKFKETGQLATLIIALPITIIIISCVFAMALVGEC